MMTETPRSLGERLKAARKASGLTQAQVTERLGLGANTLSQYERGDIGISDERLRALATAYGVDFYELTGRQVSSERGDEFYDGIIHSLATFNRAAGELLEEVQQWRQSKRPTLRVAEPPARWLSDEEIDADIAAVEELEAKVAEGKKKLKGKQARA